VLDELLPVACHVIEQYANNPIESDHGRLKARLRPMRGLEQLRSTRVISTGHAFIQNLRRDHYELGVDANPKRQLPAAFTELALAIRSPLQTGSPHRIPSTQQCPAWVWQSRGSLSQWLRSLSVCGDDGCLLVGPVGVCLLPSFIL
jgi:hypothetical protein